MKMLLITILLFISYNACNSIKEQVSEGNKVVRRIEEFKQKNGNLPSKIEDIGIKETLEGPFFYSKKDSNNYMVWFGTTLGEGMYYYSDSKAWENQLRGMDIK